MVLPGLPVLLLVLVVACVAVPLSPPANDSDPEVVRRWYSLPEERGIVPQGHRVWPPSDDGSRTIRYCFEDVDSWNTLGPSFELGLAKWAPATRVSSLRFAPDPACSKTPCLCSDPHVATDETVHVMLVDDDHMTAESSLGYRPPFVDVLDPNKPRDYLQWSRDPSLHKPNALNMAHQPESVHGYKMMLRYENRI